MASADATRQAILYRRPVKVSVPRDLVRMSARTSSVGTWESSTVFSERQEQALSQGYALAE
jgi:TPP-dependent 2-oxoacid decarboxylase